MYSGPGTYRMEMLKSSNWMPAWPEDETVHLCEQLFEAFYYGNEIWTAATSTSTVDYTSISPIHTSFTAERSCDHYISIPFFLLVIHSLVLFFVTK